MKFFWGIIFLLAIPVYCYPQSQLIPPLHDFIFVDEEPEPLNLIQVRREIGFPILALKKGWEGNVYCRILIDETGAYVQHHILRSSHKVFQEAVSAHLSKIRFTPAVKDEQRIKYWVNVPFAFKSAGATKAVLYSQTQLFRMENIVRRNHKRAASWYQKGVQSLAQGDFEVAVAQFGKSLVHQPHRKPRGKGVQVLRMQTYRKRAVALYFQGKYAEAETDLSEAIGILRSEPVLRDSFPSILQQLCLDRAKIWLAHDHYGKVLAEAQFMRINHPDNQLIQSQALTLQAATYRKVGQFERALQLVEEAIEANDQDGFPLLEKGLILYQIGAFQEANIYFQAAQQLGLSPQERFIAQEQLAQSGD